MEVKTFEEFIKDKFMELEGQYMLDDDLPDEFDDWMVNLDVADWLQNGEDYRDHVELANYEKTRRR